MTNAELGTPTAEHALPAMQDTSSMEETVSLIMEMEATMEEIMVTFQDVQNITEENVYLATKDIL